jgi:hypothetical protein
MGNFKINGHKCMYGPHAQYLILPDFNKNLNVLSRSRKRNALSISTEICLVGGALLHIEICKDMMKQTFLQSLCKCT